MTKQLVDASKFYTEKNKIIHLKFSNSYTSRTKVALAMTVMAAFSLGIMMFLSHLVTFAKTDYVLRWLIPLCFALLLFTIACIIVGISVFSAKLREDVQELRYSWSLRALTLQNGKFFIY